MSEQFVKPIWSFLDAAMDVIKSEQLDAISADNRERAKQEARAYANVLAVLMPPFFSHPDEIAREAMVRWQKRKAGEDYETPGMGRLRYKPPNTTLTTAGLPKTDTSIQMTTKVIELDDATQKGIKAALESGLFTAKQLAATYSVSEAYIQSLA